MACSFKTHFQSAFASHDQVWVSPQAGCSQTGEVPLQAVITYPGIFRPGQGSDFAVTKTDQVVHGLSDAIAAVHIHIREGLVVIIQTANSSLDTVVSAMRKGAADFFVKPVAPERLTISLRNALQLDQLGRVGDAGRAGRLLPAAAFSAQRGNCLTGGSPRVTIIGVPTTPWDTLPNGLYYSLWIPDHEPTDHAT